jgi:hypothetical protein
MTIATGQTILSSDLNSLYNSQLDNTRLFNGRDPALTIYSFTMTNVRTVVAGTIQEIEQSVEFTPPTDLILVDFGWSYVPTVGHVAGSLTAALTGELLLQPISVTNALTGTVNVFNQGSLYNSSFGGSTVTNPEGQVLLAGNNYTIFVNSSLVASTSRLQLLVLAMTPLRR